MRLRKDIHTKLLSLSEDIKHIHISELPIHNERVVKHDLLDFDYSKQRISDNILEYLLQIPNKINLKFS